MNFRVVSRLLAIVLVSAGAAQAQIATSLRLTKNQYVAGESVGAVVTITNHAGQDLVFRPENRQSWLDFVVKRDSGDPTTPSGSTGIGSVKIPAGQTMQRQVNLSSVYNFSEPGSYSVYAVVRAPGQQNAFMTNRLLFNVTTLPVYWKQKVGYAGQNREFRVMQYSAGNQKTQLYVQVADDRTGRALQTYSLGEVLMFRKPQITIDRNQHLNVLFMTSPTMWISSIVDANGKLVASQYHLRAAQADPQLMTYPDGNVQVANSVVYDPKAAAEARGKAKKASDRPVLTD